MDTLATIAPAYSELGQRTYYIVTFQFAIKQKRINHPSVNDT